MEIGNHNVVQGNFNGQDAVVVDLAAFRDRRQARAPEAPTQGEVLGDAQAELATARAAFFAAHVDETGPHDAWAGARRRFAEALQRVRDSRPPDELT